MHCRVKDRKGWCFYVGFFSYSDKHREDDKL